MVHIRDASIDTRAKSNLKLDSLLSTDLEIEPQTKLNLAISA